MEATRRTLRPGGAFWSPFGMAAYPAWRAGCRQTVAGIPAATGSRILVQWEVRHATD